MQPRHGWSVGLDEAFWSRQRNRSGQPGDSERPSERPGPAKRSADTQGQIVRTLCVRLCDGYYRPISFATTKGRLAVDARRCERACSSPAKLFFHHNPGQDTADMVDRAGKPYRLLPAAFLYRSRYLADCTCRPQPWEEEAAARHRAFSQASGQAATLAAPTRSR